MAQIEAEFVANGGEFLDKPISEFFTVQSNPQLNKDSFSFSENAAYPYFTRTVFNNGIAGYVDYLDDEHKIKGNCLAVGMITMQFFYMEHDFYAGQFTKSVYPKTDKISRFNSKIAFYFIALFNRLQPKLQGGLVRDFEKSLLSSLVNLPFKNGKICLDYMERFIQQVHAERVQEVHAYLQASGLSDIVLTDDEQNALNQFSGSLNWQEFNVKNLFGTATRGKRLKSADRILGNLPFVTAGEKNTGISAFINNKVQVFPANTITIDMFGSAKYRHYSYGADDHVAVVHTQNLAKHAVLFTTSAIHKVANAGQFSYSRNFYATDADELNILLPEKDGKPDWDLMATIGRAIEKIVIADVVQFSEREMNAYQQVIQAA